MQKVDYELGLLLYSGLLWVVRHDDQRTSQIGSSVCSSHEPSTPEFSHVTYQLSDDAGAFGRSMNISFCMDSEHRSPVAIRGQLSVVRLLIRQPSYSRRFDGGAEMAALDDTIGNNTRQALPTHTVSDATVY